MNKLSVESIDRRRFKTAWFIIFIIIVFISYISLYNISAVKMLFGKGVLYLKPYDKTISTVYKDNKHFTNLYLTGDHQTGTLKYYTADNVGKFVVESKNNTITSINAQLDLQSFSGLSIIEKYHSLDYILNPLYINSDVLAAKIYILRISSQLALTGLSTGKPYTSATHTYKMDAIYSMDKTSINISMYPSDSY